MESERRFWAQDWWTHLPTNYRQECMPFSGRNPESLTGREIEHLYCLHMQRHYAKRVLEILSDKDSLPDDKLMHIAGAAYDMRLAEIDSEGEFKIL